MIDPSAQSAAREPSAQDPPADPTPWNPDIDNGLKLNTNPFERFDVSGNPPSGDASLHARMTIQDATVDTAPLQGTRDLSDDDHLGP